MPLYRTEHRARFGAETDVARTIRCRPAAHDRTGRVHVYPRRRGPHAGAEPATRCGSRSRWRRSIARISTCFRPEAGIRAACSWGCAPRAIPGHGHRRRGRGGRRRAGGPTSSSPGDRVFADISPRSPSGTAPSRSTSCASEPVVPADPGWDELRAPPRRCRIPRSWAAQGLAPPRWHDLQAGREGPHRRRVGERRPVRGPAREGHGRGGHRRRQRAEARLRPGAGADHVIDYRTVDYTRVASDTTGSLPFRRAPLRPRCPARPGARSDLHHDGRNGGHDHRRDARWLSGVRAQRPLVRLACGGGSRSTSLMSAAVARAIEQGKLAPAIDRTYPLDQIVDALRYVNEGHPRGKVLIKP